MSQPQHISYAIFAAEQVIDIYEKQYPKDDRPRKAIEAAKKVLKDDSLENRRAATEAAWAAWAARAAEAAEAAGAARAAEGAAEAAGAAGWAAGVAEAAMRLKILRYGMELLEGK